MSDQGDDWVMVFRSVSEEECRQRSLVLQALGTVHQIRREWGGFTLWVAEGDAPRSRMELDAFAMENRDPPVAPVAIRILGDGWNGLLGFIAILSLMAVFQKRQTFGVDWFSIGKTNAGLIRGGEWWRAVTALTLHLDLLHILSNMAIGGLVGLFAGQAFGSGRAWFSILVAGALGNLVNAWIRPAEHTSAGASTAVFAALGLLAAHGWQRRRSLSDSRLYRWAPIIGGVLLLSFLGTGGERTDVGAHVFGFLCAIPLAALIERVHRPATPSPRTQLMFGFAALTILGGAWALALMRASPSSG